MTIIDSVTGREISVQFGNEDGVLASLIYKRQLSDGTSIQPVESVCSGSSVDEDNQRKPTSTRYLLNAVYLMSSLAVYASILFSLTVDSLSIFAGSRLQDC